MRRVLVTGAAGFIGSHLVETLIHEGYQVRGFDNLTTGNRSNLKDVWKNDAFAFLEGDVRDKDAIEEAIADIDCIFHLAAYTSVPGSFEKPGQVTDVNCTGTATVLEVAREAAVDGVVFASSSAVYGSGVSVPIEESADCTPASPYALSKWYAERIGAQLASDSPFTFVVTRFFNVYGPRQDPSGSYAAVIPAFLSNLARGESPVIFGDGEQTRDFVFVDDLVDGLLRAGERAADGDLPGRVYNLGGGNRITINDLAREAIDAMDADLEPVYDDPRPGDVRHSQADISLARTELGYAPQTPLSEGLQRVVETSQTHFL